MYGKLGNKIFKIVLLWVEILVYGLIRGLVFNFILLYFKDFCIYDFIVKWVEMIVLLIIYDVVK